MRNDNKTQSNFNKNVLLILYFGAKIYRSGRNILWHECSVSHRHALSTNKIVKYLSYTVRTDSWLPCSDDLSFYVFRGLNLMSQINVNVTHIDHFYRHGGHKASPLSHPKNLTAPVQGGVPWVPTQAPFQYLRWFAAMCCWHHTNFPTTKAQITSPSLSQLLVWQGWCASGEQRVPLTFNYLPVQ